MPTLQRRPRQLDDDAEEQERPRQRQRREDNAESDGAGENDEDAGDGVRDDSTETQLVKKLVRYALACEYSRTPIRRDGIRDKVLGPHGRAFRKVFDGAQKQLRAVFGMAMVELPVRDRDTLSVEEQRRAAKSQSRGHSTPNAYILVSQLPESYRSPAIITPSRVGSREAEATFVGLYSLVVTLIVLNGGQLSDQKLRRYLQRLNANVNTPLEKTDVLLQRLVRQGYVVKTVDTISQGDDESITWHVGPRGRQEITDEAVASIVREVYGDAANDDLERRLQSSLHIKDRKKQRNGAAAEASGSGAAGNGEADDDEED